MRNWNKQIEKQKNSVLRRFEPTYEELKPGNAQWSSTSTFWVLSLPMRNWNSEWVSSIMRRKKVLSLPMRNWNSLMDIVKVLAKSVLSLPMRNWNSDIVIFLWVFEHCFEPTYEELKLPLPLPLPLPLSCFLAYLWGIETFLLCLDGLFFHRFLE